MEKLQIDEAIKALGGVIDLKKTPIYNSNTKEFYADYNFSDETLAKIKNDSLNLMETEFNADMYNFVQFGGHRYKIPNSLFFEDNERRDEFEKLYNELYDLLEPSEDELFFEDFESFIDVLGDSELEVLLDIESEPTYSTI
jgi:hypothetical protein